MGQAAHRLVEAPMALLLEIKIISIFPPVTKEQDSLGGQGLWSGRTVVGGPEGITFKSGVYTLQMLLFEIFSELSFKIYF